LLTQQLHLPICSQGCITRKFFEFSPEQAVKARIHGIYHIPINRPRQSAKSVVKGAALISKEPWL